MAETDPVQNVAGVTGDPPRQRSQSGRQPRRGASTGEPRPAPPPAAPPAQPALPWPAPDAALSDILDRLRTTSTLAPAEDELARHLRGARYYQEHDPAALGMAPVADDAVSQGEADLALEADVGSPGAASEGTTEHPRH